MNVNALRIWGIAVSASLMAGALAVATFAREPAPQTLAEPGVFEIAQAPSARAAGPISFLVRFQGSGPIARAQALAARGRMQQAQTQIEAQLRRQAGFRGLCFDRFTVGGAEVVLRTCAAIVPSERAAVQARWLAQLRDMRGVAYADVNTTASQQRAPG
jgi:hypothetical protein